MIRAIQPVSSYHCSPALALCSERVRFLACLAQSRVTPDCLTVLMGIRRQDFYVHVANLPTFAKVNSEAVQPSQQWQPWPAHAAYADEVTRWWPSDEKPVSASVTPIVCEREADLVFIPMPVRGGLLNLSA